MLKYLRQLTAILCIDILQHLFDIFDTFALHLLQGFKKHFTPRVAGIQHLYKLFMGFVQLVSPIGEFSRILAVGFWRDGDVSDHGIFTEDERFENRPVGEHGSCEPMAALGVSCVRSEDRYLATHSGMGTDHTDVAFLISKDLEHALCVEVTWKYNKIKSMIMWRHLRNDSQLRSIPSADENSEVTLTPACEK